MYAGTYESKNEVYEEKRKSGEITAQLATLGDRFIALFIDYAIVAVISGVLTTLIGRSEAGVAMFFIVQVIYQWYFLVNRKEQTPGKALKHLAVVKLDGTPINGADVVLRVVGYSLNNIFMLGWCWAGFDEQRQGWHDKLAKTVVVQQ